MRRSLQIKRQRHELRQIVLRISPLVRQIPVAHGSQRHLRFLGVAKIPLHLGPHVEPLRVRNIQVDVISARVHRRKHDEQRFARIEGDRRLSLSLGQSLGLLSRRLRLTRWRRLGLTLGWSLGLSLWWNLVLSLAFGGGGGVALSQADNCEQSCDTRDQKYSKSHAETATQDCVPWTG